MPTINKDDARLHLCPFNEFNMCLGKKCMAWVDVGNPWEFTTTDNLQQTPDGMRPIGDPAEPDGEGWERYGDEYEKGYDRRAVLNLPKARAQKWRKRVAVDRGTCGRVDGREYF